MRQLLLGVMAVCIILAPRTATAADAADRVLATSCTGCHAEPATASGIPSLAGQTTQQLETMLLAYKQGSRHGTLMDRIARGYSDDELKRIAAALASAAGTR